jgi:hypothetical protein
MSNTNAVRIGTVISVQSRGGFATYRLDTGYEWEDAAGVFSKGERVRVVPYMVELVHVDRIDS